MWCASRVSSWPFAFSDIRQWYEASCVIRFITICWWLLPCLSIENVTEIETHLNNDFSNLCEWFLENKLSIHFGEDKTKAILFGTKRKLRKVGTLNITYQGIDINQNSQVTYLGCILDETMCCEPMAIKKINSRLNYFCTFGTCSAWGTTMKIRLFCLFCVIPARKTLFAFVINKCYALLFLFLTFSTLALYL